jgi:predicted ribosome quality control (RQC) complex YloA/Tae2 family protein
MTDKIKEKLQEKIKEVEDQLKQQNEYYEKLTNEAKIVFSNIKTLDGALQGFRLSMQITDDDQNNSAHNIETITDIVENK